MWYPENKDKLIKFIEDSFNQDIDIKLKKINGLVVPHAGYEYSGNIAGKAFSLLKNEKIEKAIILGPSHYIPINKPLTTDKKEIKTPLGSIKTFNLGFIEENIDKEHSINNQIPFLQYLGIKEILPLMIGDITKEKAKEIALKISEVPAIYIFSTDLSHFLKYEDAKSTDLGTIHILESMNSDLLSSIEACGYYPLMILLELCKIKKTKLHLIEYKNSGDVTGDKSQVVGYASFWF
ncbi:MAG: AmmeMemoRadiSam system protein B [Nanoarchaeota archaeon]|nr:AmmeMemoRadiSam system protein B [Nanoarchaeota archaeon]